MVDDDIFDARLNMHGVAAKVAYNLSAAVNLALTYNYGWWDDHSLGTGGTPIAIGINPLNRYQMFFADLNIKF